MALLLDGDGMMDRRDATQIGARADAALRESDQRWRVLASVSDAIYIESDAEELLWISSNSRAMHSRAVLLGGVPPGRPAAETECVVEAGSLRIGSELRIRFRDAAVWQCQLSARDAVCAAESPQRMADAVNGAARGGTPKGVFTLLTLPASAEGIAGPREPFLTGLAAVVGPAIMALSQVSAGRGVSAGIREATGLVGLGEGLTPSGDDLLGGFLFTLRALDSGLRGRLGVDWRSVDAWLHCVKPLTNKISFAVLSDHTHGEAAAPLSDLLGAALGGSSEERLAQLARRVAEIGHSSGWDMLAGVQCACLCVTRILEDPCFGLCVAADRGQASKWSKRQKEVVRVC